MTFDTKEFRKKLDSINKRMVKLNKEKHELLHTCPHNELPTTYREVCRAELPSYIKMKYGANTGNYDPHEDCYWLNITCEICDSRWTIYSN